MKTLWAKWKKAAPWVALVCFVVAFGLSPMPHWFTMVWFFPTLFSLATVIWCSQQESYQRICDRNYKKGYKDGQQDKS